MLFEADPPPGLYPQVFGLAGMDVKFNAMDFNDLTGIFAAVGQLNQIVSNLSQSLIAVYSTSVDYSISDTSEVANLMWAAALDFNND